MSGMESDASLLLKYNLGADEDAQLAMQCLLCAADGLARAEDEAGFEIERRNVLLGAITVAGMVMGRQGIKVPLANLLYSEALSGTQTLAPQRLSRGAYASLGTWRRRGRLLYASIVDTQPRQPSGTNLELLQSLTHHEARYQHDLSVTII